jgi:hypothetical protein
VKAFAVDPVMTSFGLISATAEVTAGVPRTVTTPPNSDVLLLASVAVAVRRVPPETPPGVGMVKLKRAAALSVPLSLL